MKEARTIAQLIAETDHSRTLLENAILAQDPLQLEVEGVCGPWSVKDIMAHVTAWELRMVEWLDQILIDHYGVEFLDQELAPEAVDAYNAQVFHQYAGMDVQKVKSVFFERHQPLLDYIARLPEEHLFNADKEVEQEHPLWHLVAGNTFWHYDDHLAQIERQPWYQEPKK